MPKRIVFTGGHHNSALAVALDLKYDGYDIYWLGHKYSMWGDKNPSAEYKEVTAAGIPFYELKAGKFYRTYHPLKLARIPNGFIEAFKYIKAIKPDLIISFGGYLAVPVAVIGWLMRIPIITHEQTAVTGLSNQLIGKFANKILLTYDSSSQYFPKEKSIVIGLPLSTTKIPKVKFTQDRKKTIFIHGGKQGSHIINQCVFSAVSRLVEKYKVIHQVGSSTVYQDYIKANEVKNRLPAGQRSSYDVFEYLPQAGFDKGLASTALVIGRSGAHTVYQIGIFGVPALFIPIPWVVNNEQQKNAEILVNAGSSELLLQKDLTPDSLIEKIELIFGNINTYRERAEDARHLFPLDAKEKMVRIIKEILGDK
jgi:UDP-N-acetylglucosamine--N-acetylmuramyl-(pentapeptide) pyrophosphoryl-undecaprenol N-acetylglucosamine transferase